MQTRLLTSLRAAPDGRTVHAYAANATYDLPDVLATRLIERGVALPIDEADVSATLQGLAEGVVHPALDDEVLRLHAKCRELRETVREKKQALEDAAFECERLEDRAEKQRAAALSGDVPPVPVEDDALQDAADAEREARRDVQAAYRAVRDTEAKLEARLEELEGPNREAARKAQEKALEDALEAAVEAVAKIEKLDRLQVTHKGMLDGHVTPVPLTGKLKAWTKKYASRSGLWERLFG